MIGHIGGEWADGVLTGPNDRPLELKGWLLGAFTSDGYVIADVICPQCHTAFGHLVGTKVGPFVCLLQPPPRRESSTAHWTNQPGLAERRYKVGPATGRIVDAMHVDGDFFMYWQLDEQDRLGVTDRNGTLWIDTADGSGGWLLIDHDQPPRPVSESEGPPRLDTARRHQVPDQSALLYRNIDPQWSAEFPDYDPAEVRGPLGNSEWCRGGCNARSAHHHVGVSGQLLRDGMRRFRAPGNRRSVNVLGVLDTEDITLHGGETAPA